MDRDDQARPESNLTQSDLCDHYNKLEEKYDDFYQFFHGGVLEKSLQHLDLHPDDRLVDVGGGTGAMAKTMMERAGLKHTPLIVDPSPQLLEKAKERGLYTMLATADEYFASSSATQYNKLLFCQCVHHFPNWKETFKVAFAKIPAGSICVIISCDSARISEPLFSAALKKQGKIVSGYDLCPGLDEIGFSTSIEEGKVVFTYTKKQWYEKMRGRFSSVLKHFTDEEIEAGIAELEQTTLKDTDVVQSETNLHYVVAVKRE